jgi:hypothetical protein
MPKGSITRELRRVGWRYLEGEPDEIGSCGAVGEYTGYCIKTARWEPPPYRGIGGSLCGQHAYLASQDRGLL